MSEPKLISPLLDGYIIGQPISDHHGVCCCPAMKESTEEKYIVKIISVPASQSKLEALLLAGAFADEASAQSYFKELSEDVVEEAVLLQRLSRLEGFASYDNWQVVPMEEGTGYQIYLLTPYRPTLEKHIQRNPMTHLGAVNLGLDLCSALAACRRSGYVFADLKPGNIYICDGGEYRIGDLGFISQASLPYASLPDKYRSSYTPPEIADAYSALNDTLDIFALGLVLYQIYNGGVLPFSGQAPAESLPSPEYADYEMAEIILKACAPTPADRWQDPTEMGQALVNYMQRNGVNDIPIIPPVIPSEPTAPEDASETPEMPSDNTDEEAVAAEEIPEETAEEATEEPAVPAEEVLAEPNTDDVSEEMDISVGETDDISEWEQLSLDDVIPDAGMVLAMEAAEVSDEVSQMLAQADDLIAHETPEGVVAPEPIDVPIPPRILPEEEPAEPVDSDEDTAECPEIAVPVPEEVVDAPEEVPEETADMELPEETDTEPQEAEEKPAAAVVSVPKKKKRWGLLITVVITALLLITGWLFYRNHVLQTVLAIHLSGNEDRLTVTLDTDTPDAWLTVACTDPHGNTLRQPVKDGVAKFSGLSAKTRYTVTVEVSGFHILIGKTSDSYITAEETTITSFNAVTGNTAGSVVLSFSLDGPETNQWSVTYYAKGEMEKTTTFTGHTVTIDGLAIGKTYTFLLEPVADLYVVGTDRVEFTVTRILYPENLAIQGFRGNAMTVTWDTPAGETVESWEVHCYNGMGYDKTITVTENTAVFEELDTTTPYTVEVNVTGMSMYGRTGVSANPITIQKTSIDGSQATGPVVSWEYEGVDPAGGWLVLYSISGIDKQLVVKTTTPSASLPPLIPGCSYAISIQAAAGNDVFGGEVVWAAAEAESFSGYLVEAQHIECSMCLTPAKSSWTYKDVKKYTTVFKAGESASFTMYLDHEYSTSSDQIVILYLIRDNSGKIVSSNTEATTWNTMWKSGRGKLTIPVLPDTAGQYTIGIYFNAGFITEQDFTVQ